MSRLGSLLVLLLFGIVCWPNASADDWPTHLHDNRRSGVASESLELPLELSWSTKLPTPEPAWPPPARQDYWHRKTDLSPRVVHDRANHVVVADGMLVVGSSADDRVRALDAATGKLVWTAYAEAPIRLAPTVWQQLVLFGADDGMVYGVELESGKRLWKTRAPEVGLRRIPGNGRIISERPIRSGVMVNDEGTGYFVAGIFPKQGAFFYSIDVRTGKILDQAPIEKSVQGYLEQRNDGIFAPTGRDPQGTTLAGDPQSAFRKTLKSSDAPIYSRIADATHDYLGLADKVVALVDGKQAWQATVDGRVYDLAIADGQLFVSTDSGRLYAFANAPANSADKHQAAPATADAALLDQAEAGANVTGYALYIDPLTNEQTDAAVAFATESGTRVILAVADERQAAAVNKRIDEIDARGMAVHVHASLDNLPYADHIFSRIMGGKCEQVKRLLVPHVGIAECSDGRLEHVPPADESAWSHAYGNVGNTASNDTLLGNQPLQLQWFGGPGPRHLVDRHMRTMPPLANGGILYLPGLNRVIALDAFTGAVRWETEIPHSTRIGILKDCGWMVARDDSLLVAVGNSLTQYVTTPGVSAAPSAKVIHTVPFADRDWGCLASMDNRIIGSSVLPDSPRRTVNREAILEGAYSDNRPIVCSDGLFAFDESKTTTAEDRVWQRHSRGAILNPTIAVTQRIVVFVENACQDFEQTRGRIRLADFLNDDARLVAVDLHTGQQVWDVKLPPVAGAQNAFVLCDEDHVVLVTSRNAETVHYDVQVYHSHNGQPLWNATQDNRKKPGGDHGEQDKHPVLVGGRLIVEPFAYDVHTGKELVEVDLNQRGYGCGTLSAAADTLFFRSGNPARYSLQTNKLELLTSVTRPGCWINMIPASGMLLIPDGSSGCTCNYAVQTSMALVPVASPPGSTPHAATDD